MSDSNIINAKLSEEIIRALVIAAVIGILISVPLIINAVKGDYYSSVYLLPENYTNYPQTDHTSFVYGVKCNEKEITSYYLDFYLGDRFIERKNLRLYPGESIENEYFLNLYNETLPKKLIVVLTSPYDKYHVGYWIKNVK